VSAVKPAMLAAWLKPAPSPVAFTGNPNFQRPGNVKFPAPAAVPTVGQMRSLLAGLEAIPPEHDRRPRIIPLSDDWRTRGRELDNYGRLIGWMAAMNGNVDQSTTETVFKAGYQGYTDTHWRRGDHIRRWTSTAVTSDPRALQDPGTGHRNMSSWDDHGETYPVADDGPNIFFTLALPAGQYVVSLYFVNDDAHAGLWNSQRDYTISMRAVPGMPVAEFAGLPQDGRAGVASYRTARREPRSRVTEFWPGVYKRFFVSLPGKGVRLLTIRVRRNNSFNTIMSGIFVDQYPRLPKQCVVPPLILPYRPFRSYLAWKRDPYPPSILRPLARMWLKDILLQIKIGPDYTMATARQNAEADAMDGLTDRDLLEPDGPYGPLPKLPEAVLRAQSEALIKEHATQAQIGAWEERCLREQSAKLKAELSTAAGRRQVFRRVEIPLTPSESAAQADLRQLLYLRTGGAAWFAVDAYAPVIALSRFLVAHLTEGAPLITKLGNSGFEPPVLSKFFFSTLLENIGMPIAGDRVFFRSDSNALFAYRWKAMHPGTNLTGNGWTYGQLMKTWTKEQRAKEMVKW